MRTNEEGVVWLRGDGLFSFFFFSCSSYARGNKYVRTCI